MTRFPITLFMVPLDKLLSALLAQDAAPNRNEYSSYAVVIVGALLLLLSSVSSYKSIVYLDSTN